ncbi:MAG TPA: tetratricopeptide repeat protein [Pyrinomonadaceae bacterium]|nr:tetratricopeptide repeat protein [Pyrinomonadaceae bacterium]
MKRCPECGRNYNDDSMSFCLDDGVELLFGPASGDEPETAILLEPGKAGARFSDSDSPTRSQIDTTDQAATFHSGTETERQRRSDGSHDLRETPSRLAARGVVSRNGRARLLLGVGVAALLLATGFFSYRYLRPADANRQIDSIAVLPFQNRNGDPDSEYLSDGLAESLIYRLTQLPNLKVSPTSSVVRYKGKDADVGTIANELGVDAVMTGRLAQRGDNLTISVELVDVRNNKLLWGEQYDRKMTDLLATQREIATTIAQKLELRLSGDENKGLTRQYTNNNEAYQLYLKGRYFWSKRNPDSIRKAIEYFNLAIEKDPGFALAYSGLADAYVVPANRLEPRDAMPKAKTAATRALAIDPTLAEAHTSLARVLQVYDWNWEEAEKEFKRAIELDPRYAVAHQWYGGLLERTGHIDESIAERKLALELDPLSAITHFELAQAYYFARDYDRSIEQFQKTLELDPNFSAALQYLPLAYAQKRMFDEAIEALESAPTDTGLVSTGAPGSVYAMAGHTDKARKMVEDLKALRDRKQYVPAVGIASIYAALGEKDEALAWLEKGYEERGFQMQYLKVEPRWDNLRSDARFTGLIRRIGLPE